MWRADLAAVPEELTSLLSAEERARCERFPPGRDPRSWGRARGLLRELLGGYLQRDPSALRFATGAHGKLALMEDAPRSSLAQQSWSQGSWPLSFNLSHSGHLALYAFARAGAVGVDIQLARPRVNELAIAARAFGAAEANRLGAMDPPVREREFLAAWARHEAKTKCLGTGIAPGATSPNGADLWVIELEVGPRASAALALERFPLKVRCWAWHTPHPSRLEGRFAQHGSG